MQNKKAWRARPLQRGAGCCDLGAAVRCAEGPGPKSSGYSEARALRLLCEARPEKGASQGGQQRAS